MNCKVCVYFCKMNGDLYGTCRRYPPKVITLGTLQNTYWPTVDPEQWCGEFLDQAERDRRKSTLRSLQFGGAKMTP